MSGNAAPDRPAADSAGTSSATELTFRSVHERFLELEAELDLFDWLIDGVPVWERVRFDVNKRILEGTGLLGAAHERDDGGSTRAAVADMLRSVSTRNPYLTPAADVAFFTHPRRKRLEDGLWWNIRCDPVIERLGCDVAALESGREHGHRRPARTDDLRYLDPVERLADLRRRFAGDWSFDARDEKRLDRLEAAIRERFGVDVDVGEMVGHSLSSRRRLRPSYEALLDRMDPDVAVVTVSYGRERAIQIEACKRRGVPVAELQHGVIDPYHVGYSFPGPGRRKRMFPDYLLVYGRFWRDAVEYPIPDERVLPVGYPYIESQRPTDERSADREQIVFVSQGAIGEQLSRFAASLAADPAFETDIVYKLHPAEVARYPESYPWLAAADVAVADGSDRSLYELFEASTAQVGVYSTAVYEGLRFGLRTYLYDLPGSAKLRALVDEDIATPVASVTDLVDAERSARGTVPFDTDRIFEPTALEAVPRAIERIRTADRPDDPRDDAESDPTP
ncbi:hypothetical protein [Halorubrum kocurii]|uniref:Capsule polysaccharide biosynthesis protein n=1 Tax=Halorubrum kocurii JCM 14978 TaxID=1230456 RepID=M0P6V7_9EURY|nr:hypothetical protein [Halorubrum kocurii]EMA65538.1 hypothetical protein C468_06138 [Halorubrum kocurii JCM 14978]